jgi:hypothetical protein
MKPVHTIACIAALVALAAGGATSAQPPAPSRVSITLPGDLGFAFKPGPGSAEAQARCLTCHSSAYVSTQQGLDRAHWVAEVTKMRKVYGAPMTDADAATIVDYLTVTYGKP